MLEPIYNSLRTSTKAPKVKMIEGVLQRAQVIPVVGHRGYTVCLVAFRTQLHLLHFVLKSFLQFVSSSFKVDI